MVREGMRCQQSGEAGVGLLYFRERLSLGQRVRGPCCDCWTGLFSLLTFRPELIRAADLFEFAALEAGPPSWRRGRAASYLPGAALDHPGREGGLWGTWHIPPARSVAAASAPRPRPRPGVRPPCGEAGPGSRGERFYSSECAVCLSASRGLGPPYSQVSHTLKHRLSSGQDWVR